MAITQPVYIQVGSPEWNELMRVVKETITEEVNYAKNAREDIWITTDKAMEIAGRFGRQEFYRFLKKYSIPTKRVSYRKILIERRVLVNVLKNLEELYNGK